MFFRKFPAKLIIASFLLCGAITTGLLYQGQKRANATLTESLNQSTDTIAGLRDTLNMVSTESAYQLAQRDSIIGERDSMIERKDVVISTHVTKYRALNDSFREYRKSSVAAIADLNGQLVQTQTANSSLYSQLDDRARQNSDLNGQISDLSEFRSRALCQLSSLVMALISGRNDGSFIELQDKLEPFCNRPSEKVCHDLYFTKRFERLRNFAYKYKLDLECVHGYCVATGINPEDPDIGTIRKGLRTIRDYNFKPLLVAAGASDDQAERIVAISKMIDI